MSDDEVVRAGTVEQLDRIEGRSPQWHSTLEGLLEHEHNAEEQRQTSPLVRPELLKQLQSMWEDLNRLIAREPHVLSELDCAAAVQVYVQSSLLQDAQRLEIIPVDNTNLVDRLDRAQRAAADVLNELRIVDEAQGAADYLELRFDDPALTAGQRWLHAAPQAWMLVPFYARMHLLGAAGIHGRGTTSTRHDNLAGQHLGLALPRSQWSAALELALRFLSCTVIAAHAGHTLVKDDDLATLVRLGVTERRLKPEWNQVIEQGSLSIGLAQELRAIATVIDLTRVADLASLFAEEELRARYANVPLPNVPVCAAHSHECYDTKAATPVISLSPSASQEGNGQARVKQGFDQQRLPPSSQEVAGGVGATRRQGSGREGTRPIRRGHLHLVEAPQAWASTGATSARRARKS